MVSPHAGATTTKLEANLMRILSCLFLFALSLTMPAAAESLELNIIAPGVVYNAGLREFADGFTRETGIKVHVTSSGMSKIAGDIKTGTPPADVVFLPLDIMDALEKEGGTRPGSRLALGRVNIGLAIHKGDPAPDISTVDKLAAVLTASDGVMYSDPTSGSMEARIIDGVLNAHPEFAKVKRKISKNGEGGQAVARGEGQMALQLICEIINHPDELSNVGPVPDSLGAYIDSAAGVTARSAHPKEAAAFLKYATQPGTYSLWLGHGLERAKQ